jgi:phage tail tape-measure protein
MFDHTWRLGDVSDVAATAALNGSGYACKVDGCSEPASANRGPNAYRCEKHKHARKPKAEPRKQPPASGSGSLDTLAAKVQSARGDLTAALAAFDEAVAAVREAAA